MEEGRLRTTPEAFLRRFASEQPPMRIAIEAGTHSPWASRVLEELGHQVLVANARKLRFIYSRASERPTRRCLENLARLARLDPKLLSPLQHDERPLIRSTTPIGAHKSSQAAVLSGYRAESSLTLTPLETKTRLIAPAHAGSASRKSASSAMRTTFAILWETSSAHSRGSALTSNPCAPAVSSIIFGPPHPREPSLLCGGSSDTRVRAER
jgi:transposase